MPTTSLRRILATACLAFAALTVPVGCGKSDGTETRTRLDLSVTAGKTLGVEPTRVSLTCEPAGGDHPHPDGACASLIAAGGDFDKLVGDPSAMCAQVYDPVTATATGTWQGKAVKWEKQFGNSCELRAKTTPVF
ncbi:subtilase-type protease inhibitor [Nocardia brasiliensis]|uniref:subtilase-type protease inhibitor n=1 Tax=Nocardia brasiliensis TaxID=37326 RepID=UPI00142D38A4|nr:subtilase-type protease inhibitor [Nocardia brasiliensis]